MAKKSKGGKTRPGHKKPIGKTNKVLQNYVSLGGSSRRFKNVKTGQTISRRQFEKLSPPTPIRKKLGSKKSRERISKNREAQARYQRLVEDYIRTKRKDNITVGKRAARNSRDLKQIVRHLKSKNPDYKAEALFKVGRIRQEEIVQYVEKFAKETGGVKIKLQWRVVSKRTGSVAFEGSYSECVRWLSFGSRRQRYRLEADEEEIDEDEEGEE